MAQGQKQDKDGTLGQNQKKDPIQRRMEVSQKRTNAFKALTNAFAIAQQNGYSGLSNLNPKRPKQVLHTKGDVNGALFKIDNETYKQQIAEPLKEAANDIKEMKYSNSVQKALQNFIDLKAAGGGRGPTTYEFSADF